MSCTACSSSGSCATGGCGKMSATNWISDIYHEANAAYDKIEVLFKGGRKDYFSITPDLYVEAGDMVTAEIDNKQYDIGHVSLTGLLVKNQLKVKGIKEESVKSKILRLATDKEIEDWKKIKVREKETVRFIRKIVGEHKLNMRISDVEFQGDGKKITIYYTASERVDFRELLKTLIKELSAKIEMRQIGVRQESARLGGIGTCGRELCCSTWLTKFKTVNLQAARYQNLSLNSSKLSGQCGKLKCCLNYEFEVYLDALKEIPKDINNLNFEEGKARHIKTDIFKKELWFSMNGEDMFYLNIKEVLHIKDLNKKKIFPTLHKFKKVEEAPSDNATHFSTAADEGSLDRFNSRTPNKKKKKKKKKKPFDKQ